MFPGVVTSVRVAAALLAMTLALPAPAAAQRPAGPFAGLFGRTPPRTGQDATMVEARGTLGGQYDGILRGAQPEVPLAGGAASANAALSFERRRDRFELRGRAEAARQQFIQTPALGGTTYDTRVTVAAPLTTRLTINGTASATRSAFFQFAFATLPGDTPGVMVPADRLTTQLMPHDDFQGTAGLTSQFSKRSSISASVSKRATIFRNRPVDDYSAFGSRADFRHRLNRTATLRVAYGREQARHAVFGPGEFVHEVIDAGIDLDRELAITRRLTFGFYAQNSMVREAGGPRRYRLNGGITLRRAFGRSWSAAMAVNRDTTFEPGLTAPLFADGGSLTLGGLLSSRFEWTTSVGGRRGHVGYASSDKFQNYNATTRLTTALTKKTGLFAQYSYYDYTVPPGATIAGLLPSRSSQQVSAGVTLWLPIFNNVRPIRDSR